MCVREREGGRGVGGTFEGCFIIMLHHQHAFYCGLGVMQLMAAGDFPVSRYHEVHTCLPQLKEIPGIPQLVAGCVPTLTCHD